jgi:hypothetical protein
MWKGLGGLIVLGVWVSACAPGGAVIVRPKEAEVRLEALLDEDTRGALLPPALASQGRFLEEEGVQGFVAELPFERRRSEQHFLFMVALAPAGRFLGTSPHEADTVLPGWGWRARREFFGLGPGGSSYGLTLTTGDGRYDIRLGISELLPEGVDAPEVDLDRWARRMAERYDAWLRRP